MDTTWTPRHRVGTSGRVPGDGVRFGCRTGRCGGRISSNAKVEPNDAKGLPSALFPAAVVQERSKVSASWVTFPGRQNAGGLGRFGVLRQGGTETFSSGARGLMEPSFQDFPGRQLRQVLGDSNAA